MFAYGPKPMNKKLQYLENIRYNEINSDKKLNINWALARVI